ncbi:hypothetical protein FDZ73_25180 [bacterium]|nr:MAG: hypothetical protein FDZ73_25180 [bacterium]
MSTTQVKLVIVGLLFVFIFVCGYILSRAGKPYPMVLFTLHKLLTLGTVVFLALSINKIAQVSPLSQLQILAVVITSVLFLATIATGGVVSAATSVPMIARGLHHIVPYLALLSSAWMIFIVFIKNSLVASGA